MFVPVLGGLVNLNTYRQKPSADGGSTTTVISRRRASGNRACYHTLSLAIKHPFKILFLVRYYSRWQLVYLFKSGSRCRFFCGLIRHSLTSKFVPPW
ncbi:hypothetical protein O9929_08055 [Vibrio lentus]|nr:hypothetical protein [Vibrio lentus]